MQNLKFLIRSTCAAAAVCLLLASGLPAAAQQSQQGLTWEQVKAKFEAANPVLKADAASVGEMKAEEITAFLRPNPQVGLSSDGLQIAPHTTPGLGTHWMPLTGTQLVPSINYLHEREHKWELRLESAKEGTQITGRVARENFTPRRSQNPDVNVSAHPALIVQSTHDATKANEQIAVGPSKLSCEPIALLFADAVSNACISPSPNAPSIGPDSVMLDKVPICSSDHSM